MNTGTAIKSKQHHMPVVTLRLKYGGLESHDNPDIGDRLRLEGSEIVNRMLSGNSEEYIQERQYDGGE